MKLSTKSRYAVRSMIHLAQCKDVLSITEISNNQNISERYLELIFSQLKHSGLIKSIRGSRGGYQLAKPAHCITIYDIISTMEKDASIIRENKEKDVLKKILTKEIWNPIDKNIEDYLKSIKLSSLL